MKGKEAYETYLAVRTAFTGDYDYFKYSGRIHVSNEAWMELVGRHHYSKLGKLFKDDRELAYYLALDFFLHGTEKWAQYIKHDVATVDFAEWKMWQTHRMERFEGFLKFYLDKGPSLSAMCEYLFDKMDKHPSANLVIAHSTMIYMLDEVYDVIDARNKKLQGDYIWDTHYENLKYFQPFFKNYKPVSHILIKKIVENTLTFR